MKLVFALFLCAVCTIGVYSADIVELVKILDANDTSKFKSYVISSEDANAMRDDNNKTILMYASWIGNFEAVEYLVSKGADVNAQDMSGASALHLAIWKNHEDVTLYLLRHGASTHSMSTDGMTPLDIAILRSNQTIIKEINNSAPKLKTLL
jgi:ankyrin repeat protein